MLEAENSGMAGWPVKVLLLGEYGSSRNTNINQRLQTFNSRTKAHTAHIKPNLWGRIYLKNSTLTTPQKRKRKYIMNFDARRERPVISTIFYYFFKALCFCIKLTTIGCESDKNFLKIFTPCPHDSAK